MINHSKILLILFFALSLKGQAQEKVLLGVQLGPNVGYPKGPEGTSSGSLEGVWGINVGLINKHGISLETGRYKYAVDYSVAIPIPDHTHSFGGSITAIQIPFRLQKRFNLRKNKIFFSPSIGFSYLYRISRSSYNGTVSVIYSIDDTIHYSLNSTLLCKNTSLLETGVKVEFVILKYLTLNIASYYSYGLRSLGQTTITWNQPSLSKSGVEKVTARGNNLQFFVGLSYSIYDKQRDIHNQQRRLERINKKAVK